MSCRTEGGTAVVEFTWLVILLMVPLLYAVLAVFEVQRAAFAVSTAARAAGRAFVQAPDEGLAPSRAEIAVRLALDDQGVAMTGDTLRLSCAPEPTNCLAPGSVVHVRVHHLVTLPLLPDFLGGQRPGVRVEAEHAVPYGTYREDR